MSDQTPPQPSRLDDEDKLLPEWSQSADNQIIWLGLLVVGLILFGGLLLSRCGDGVGPFASGDESVDTDFSASLETDLSVDADFDLDDVDVDLRDGDTAVLTGEVESAAARLRAGEIALDHPDVGRIDNRLTVAGSASAAWLLDAQRQLAGEGRSIGVGQRDGDVAVLTGEVADQAAKDRAEELAGSVDGVNSVDNRLSIAKPVPTAEPEPEATAEPTAEPEPEATAEPTPEPTAEPTEEPEPEPTPEPTEEPAPDAPAATIAELASGDGQLSTLAELVGNSPLGEFITDPNLQPQVTIFAPNNDAFAAQGLDGSPDVVLNETLEYHVYPGVLNTADLSDGQVLTMVNGETVTVTKDGDSFVLTGVNDASMVRILDADVGASNGVVHVVDGVLLPSLVVGGQELQASLNDIEGLIDVQFAVGSDAILPESEADLDQAAELIKGTSGVVAIVGHTDSDGDDALNLTLSENRAAAVKVYLVSKGVDADRLTTSGEGETNPVAPNDTAENKALNRRIEFQVN